MGCLIKMIRTYRYYISSRGKYVLILIISSILYFFFEDLSNFSANDFRNYRRGVSRKSKFLHNNDINSDPAILPMKKRIASDRNETRIGLSAIHEHFYLNNKQFRILSGEVHYFRIPRSHWKHRLKALRAVGLNTVSTYIPWNAHNPYKNDYNFKKENIMVAAT